jgi:3-dehydroquinate synthase
VSDTITVQSHTGPYTVDFDDALLCDPKRMFDAEAHVLIDAAVARLYKSKLAPILDRASTIVVEATEENKSLARTIPVFERLVQNRVRRHQTLVAIGGGVVQDITCFVASTLLRGLAWHFIPTTLLAQADSCIGSKSSLNLGSTKNVLGTFNPPKRIFIDSVFLDTLDRIDLHSGVGEILKVHAIEGPAAFDMLAGEFDLLFTERAVLRKYIRAALLIKRRFIEADEFDFGIRNILNYGHSFGHAIESATRYTVPHGIAVTMGMDMANHIAVGCGLLPVEHRDRMRPTLCRNYASHASTPIAVDDVLRALLRDKKNTSTGLRLILPVGGSASLQRVEIAPDDRFRALCREFLERRSG